MYPPIYEVCSQDTGVTDLIGNNPVRFSAFGESKQNGERPYAVWQLVSGTPENFLNQRPDMNFFSIQVDAYAKDAKTARDIASALIYALELHAHVSAFNGEGRDTETRLYRYSFTVDWWVKR